ncbi:MAG: hypothetical protein QXG97_03045 [Nitrososphaerota archaeon]
MHSFHYHEKYARKAGIELGKLDIPYITVIESPKKRAYQRLTEQYDAKWIVDLHNDRYPYDPNIRHLIAMLYLSSTHRSKRDEERKQVFRKWIKKSYSPNKMGVYPVSIVNKTLLDKSANYVGIELYPHNSIRESIEFIKKFSNLLFLF